MANGQLGKALKKTSHEVSLQQTGKTWNSVAIYTNFSIPEKEIQHGYVNKIGFLVPYNGGKAILMAVAVLFGINRK